MIFRDKVEKYLGLALFVGICMIVAGFLVGCTSSGQVDMDWLPASQEFAEQVARDNAASAATNPVSFWLWAGGTIVSSLAGSVGLIRRGINRFDAAPFEGPDGSEMTEAELVAIAKQAKASPSAPDVKGLDS